MSLHSITRIQQLPISVEEAWDFFTSPLNLSVITPPGMNFKILSSFKPGDKIFEGMLIDYYVSPLFHIPLRWQTEITQVEPMKFFIDEQRKGPYSFWHHEHHFREVQNGVEMTDEVQWRVPLGILGDVMNAILIDRKVKSIFDFREKKLLELFPRTQKI